MTTRQFETRGINHLALVCRDMARTVDFYSGVLDMPLVKTIQLPLDMGQHFFFDCGGGNSLAFFWFPNSPDAVPGVSVPAGRPDQGDLTSAVASMNHVAFDVAPTVIEEYRDRLRAAGIDCTEVANHDDSEFGISREMNDDVFVRSIYFQDPDGILLEFAAWTKEFTAADVRHAPAPAASRPVDDVMVVAERFFAAIESGDAAAVQAMYDPAAVIWHNNDGTAQGVDENLVILSWCMNNIGAMRYEDVVRYPTPGGFVQQHVLRGTAPNGAALEVPACLVVAIAGGRITRIDEYLDSAHIKVLSE